MKIITCERCAADFRIEPSKLGPKGAHVRCGKCGHVFFADPTKEPSSEQQVVSSLTDQLFMMTSSPEDPESLPFAEVIPEEEKREPPAEAVPPPPRVVSPPAEQASPARDATPAPTRRAEALSHRPFAGRGSPVGQRLAHGSIVAAMILLGLLFGLLAMGVRPLPKELSLLLRHGKRSVPAELQILGYSGRIQALSPTERVFRITGELLNASGEDLPAPQLRMELFAPNGEFLLKSSFAPGSGRLADGTVRSFSAQVDLAAISEIGSYRISLER